MVYTGRNVADIKNAQAVEAFAVVSILIDYLSSAHLTVKETGLRAVVLESVQVKIRGQINPGGASGKFTTPPLVFSIAHKLVTTDIDSKLTVLNQPSI